MNAVPETAESAPVLSPFPESLGLSVVAVMSEIERLEKADHNKFANYDFTSVDDFKDALRPLLARFGLYAVPQQSDFKLVEYKNDKDKVSTVAQFDFDITLKHVNGDKEPAERITVFLPLTGAQTSGAARSYAIKEWLKGRFLASSGAPADVQEEADMMDQARGGLRMSKTDARDMFKRLSEEMRKTAEGRDHDALAMWWQTNKEALDSLPKDWFLNLKGEYGETWKTLKATADLDKMSESDLDELAQREALRKHPLNAG